MRRSHGFDVVPGQQLVDIGLFVPACDGCQDGGQISVGSILLSLQVSIGDAMTAQFCAPAS